LRIRVELNGETAKPARANPPGHASVCRLHRHDEGDRHRSCRFYESVKPAKPRADCRLSCRNHASAVRAAASAVFRAQIRRRRDRRGSAPTAHRCLYWLRCANGASLRDLCASESLRETKSANPYDGDSRCPLAAAVVSIACPGILRPAMPDVEAVHCPGFCRYYTNRIHLFVFARKIVDGGMRRHDVSDVPVRHYLCGSVSYGGPRRHKFADRRACAGMTL
jgi:hypothetical protein